MVQTQLQVTSCIFVKYIFTLLHVIPTSEQTEKITHDYMSSTLFLKSIVAIAVN